MVTQSTNATIKNTTAYSSATTHNSYVRIEGAAISSTNVVTTTPTATSFWTAYGYSAR